MDGRKQIIATLATFALALGIGAFMQFGGSGSSHSRADKSPDLLTVLEALDVEKEATPVAQRPAPPSADVLLGAPVPVVEPPAGDETSTFGSACSLSFMAASQPEGLVKLSVSAPCKMQAQLTVYHEGMIFNGLTDDAGYFETLVPALASPEASFAIAFADGVGGTTRAMVPQLSGLSRTVLQRSGLEGLRLTVNPIEDKITVPKIMHMAIGEAGGAMADVITYAADAKVEIAIEAVVTEENCGKKISGTLFQINQQSDPQVADIFLTVPTCDAVGDFLVLETISGDKQISVR